MAILDSVKELASKLGAETNGRDITDQLNKINKHLDKAALSGRDIAEALKTYAENAGGSNFTNVKSIIINTGSTYASGIMLCRSKDGEYILPDDNEDPRIFILLDPAIKVTVPAPGTTITFTPDENFDGFYSVNGRKMSHTGDEAIAGDGKAYQYVTSMSGNTMTKTSKDFTFTIE